MAETELSAASVEGLSYPFKDAKAREDIETLKKSVEELAAKEETDPTVPAWAKQAAKPSYTVSEVGADPAGSAADALESAKAYAAQQDSAHNADTAAHGDIRLLVQGLADRLNALADSDDTTLDQLSELVAYIKANRSLIEGVTTSKVNVADIVDDLTTNAANKPLSAAQGVALKALVDAISVPTKVSQLSNDNGYLTAVPSEYVTETELAAKGYLTEHQDISGKLDADDLPEAVEEALAQAKASGEFDGVSATHEWDGTVLTVTSASGTSSADLQGPQGDQGDAGQRGAGIYTVTTAPSSYTTEAGGFTPKYRIALSTALSQSGATEILVGDQVRYSYYIYPVGYVDEEYVYMGTRVSLRGGTGADGVGIASIEQTTTSTDDDGDNVITVTLTDGTASTFTVQNGSKGSDGADGQDAEAYAVPDYWQDAVDATIAAIKEHQDAAGADCVCFGLCSDMHVHWPYPTDNNYCRNIGNIAAAVMDGAGVPLFLNCGDILTNTVYAEESNVIDAYNWAWDNYLSIIGAERMLLVAGNHDGAYATVGSKDYAKNMKPETLHRYLYQEQMLDFRREWGASGKYFYLDNKPQKTRFVMLNSHDTEWAEDENGAAVCSTMSGGYRQEQMEWLANEALDVPEGWTIVLASHVPPTAKLPTSYSGVRGYDIVRGIVTAYAERTAYSGTYSYDSTKGEGLWADMNVSVDFADAKGTIAGWFCGHCHRDAVITGDLPFPIVTITCAGNFSYDKDNEGTRTLGEATETALDFVCIDKAAKTINTVRLGIGVDAARSAVYAGDYSITLNLANVTCSNEATLISEGEAYEATLTAADGCVLEAVTVTMGGEDITSTAYSDGVVSIDKVTGDIVITAEAVSTDPFAFVASNWSGYGGSSALASVSADGVAITKGSGGAYYTGCNHVFTRKAGTYSFEVAVGGTVATNQVNTIIRCFDASGNILEDKAVCVPNHSYTFNTAYKGFMMNSGYGTFTFTLTDAVSTFQIFFSAGSTIEVGGTCTITSVTLTEPE